MCVYIYMRARTHTHAYILLTMTALEHGIICVEYMYEQAGSSVCFSTCLCHSASTLQETARWKSSPDVLQHPVILLWDLLYFVVFFLPQRLKSRYFLRIPALIFSKGKALRPWHCKERFEKCKASLPQRFRKKTPKIIKGTLLSREADSYVLRNAICSIV